MSAAIWMRYVRPKGATFYFEPTPASIIERGRQKSLIEAVLPDGSRHRARVSNEALLEERKAAA